MVREGKAAKVIPCKEAEVKKPISSDGAFVQAEDGDERAKKVLPAHVEDGERRAKKVVSPHVEDGEAGAREVTLAHVEDGEMGAKKAVSPHVEDGEAGAKKVVLAHVEDGEASVRKMASQGRVLQALPEMADEKSTAVQQRQPQMAYDDITLSQLFAMKG